MVDHPKKVDEFGREIPEQFPRVAADAIVIRERDGDHEIMLITRKKATFQGCLAFPGGHIDYGEDPEVSCLRELKEECDVDGSSPRLVCVRGKPDRDPRYHMISIVYLVTVDPSAKPVAQDDAASAEWYKLREVLKTPERFAFDHHSILLELIEKFSEYS